MMNKAAGFTLVEIAIVVVVIGLLLGSVLKGQELITDAKMKNLETNFNSLAQAVFTYQERYSALPGDDSYAGNDDSSMSRFKDLKTVDNGNANGRIDGDYKKYTQECGKIWQHLRAAQLINGAITDNTGPPNAFMIGRVGVGSYQFNFSGVFIGFTEIPPKIAIIFDERYDGNSSPQNGRIRSERNGNLISDYTDDKNLLNLLFAL